MEVHREHSQSKPNDDLWLEKWTETPWGRVFSRGSTQPSRCRGVVILIPGMVISSRYMIPLGRVLAPQYHIHMIDFPGYGRSDKPNEVLGVSQLADVLRFWMQTNEIPKATLIANSFGCQIVADFAARYPELLEKIVLQGPTVDPRARSVFRQMVRLKLNSWRESKSVGMISVKDYRSAGLKRVIKTIRLTLRDRIEDKLTKIQTPTLIVRGSRDPVVPEEWAEKVTSLIPHAELSILEGAAHTLNYSEPEAFSRLIMDFLGKCDGRALV